MGLRDFFEKVLNDDTIIIANVGWCDLEVVVGRDDVEFEFAVAKNLSIWSSPFAM